MWFAIRNYLLCRKIGDIVVCENYCGFRVFSKLSRLRRLKMRKILCLLGIGVALFSVAGVLYVVGHSNDQSGMRTVGEDEAELVIGGGQMGASVTVSITCGLEVNGCNATPGIAFTGSSMGGAQTADSAHCGGGSCAAMNVTTATISKE
jgi:hypothetical protein